MSAMFTIELGKKVEAKVTGLVGIVTSRSECLHGCNRYFIQPAVGSDNKIVDGYWVDEDDIKVIGAGVKRVAKDTGGPMSKLR